MQVLREFAAQIAIYTVTLHAHTHGMYIVHNKFFITQVGLAVRKI